jgi:hypothetical protein
MQYFGYVQLRGNGLNHVKCLCGRRESESLIKVNEKERDLERVKEKESESLESLKDTRKLL